MSDISPELAKPPIVEIKYDRMDPKDSLFQVGGSTMGQAIVDLGYSPSVVKSLIIDNDDQTHELARYDYMRRAIVLHQKPLVENVREIYKGILRQMGEMPPKTIAQKNDFPHRFIRSKFFKTVFPAYWPYHMLKNMHVDFFAGNAQRRNNYLKAAKEGTLMPGKPIEEQISRARAFMDKLIESGIQRNTGWILAHEYEHVHHAGRKFALKMGLMIGPFVTGFAVLDAITKQMQQMNMPASNVSDAMILGIMGVGGAGLYGMAKGRAIEEQASYDAGYKNMAKYMECFKINHDVFTREVLGRVAEPVRVSS